MCKIFTCTFLKCTCSDSSILRGHLRVNKGQKGHANVVKMGRNWLYWYSTVASHPFWGFRLTRELENFRWYHVLGPHLGHTARVDVDFRSGAHLFYGVMS